MSNIVVTANIRRNVECRLAVSASESLSSPTYSAPVTPDSGLVKLSVSGLSADSEYHYGIEVDGVIGPKRGRFRTLPSGASSFRVAFSGDRASYTSSAVCAAIAEADPLFFIMTGDAHYHDNNTTSAASHVDQYRKMMDGPLWGAMLRDVAIYDVWGDHDYCGDDTDGSAAGRNAACQAFRTFWPHPSLELSGSTDAVYYSLKVGRVVFIFTDLRSLASAKSATDNSSKSTMGATQKTWFKGVLSDAANADCLFVWVSERVWGGPTTAGADHWGGYNTERVEIADYIHANCPGRVCVIGSDMHAVGIDNGANHEFCSTGSEPIPTFQASPIDHPTVEFNNGGTYNVFSSAVLGQFGVMEITDTGGGAIGVEWSARDISGTEIGSHSFTVNV